MVDSIRYAEKFENIAGTVTYTFPVEMYEYEPSQSFRESGVVAVGSDYSYDPHGISPWPVDDGLETIRFVLYGATKAAISTALDTVQAICRTIGVGKLYTIDDAGNRRWCYARPVERPNYSIGPKLPWFPPVSLRFKRTSDWFGTAAQAGSQLVDASPENFNINNPGNLPVKFIVFRLRANAGTGYTNPNIVNNTNGYQVGTNRDSATTNSEVRIDTERGTFENSTNDGGTYTADYTNAVIPSGQKGLFRLEPGINSISVTSGGTPNFQLEWLFYGAYA